ncbi:hypothetical protein [Kiritimatiella glycovorans]|uniref:DRTGG domain protein n=1 Tax=Kiritimatiella glycovorans TaxID=1307763 RepID=A0A0G3EHJ7_9BACT|nr:hypothetical protein [Kiritimatiella glycovorans]AKJ63664.1 DRTGG domain protein [Kiritimatiella glycovorans]
MKLPDLAAELGFEIRVRADSWSRVEVTRVMASDLMSDVLTEEGDRTLLVSALASDQTLRTAHLIDAAAVLVTRGKRLPESMEELSQELSVNLLRTPASTYETCVHLGRLLGAPQG